MTKEARHSTHKIKRSYEDILSICGINIPGLVGMLHTGTPYGYAPLSRVWFLGSIVLHDSIETDSFSP